MPQTSADQFFEVLQQDKTSFHRNLTSTSEIDRKLSIKVKKLQETQILSLAQIFRIFKALFCP